MSRSESSEFGLSRRQTADILAPYGVDPEPDLLERVGTYIDLLLKWNRFTSLTSVTSPAEILGLHFGESFFAAKVVPVENGRLADVGAGAGFPGLPLKLPRPEIDLTLIESNAKRAVFLAEVSRRLGLARVDIQRKRYADITPGSRAYDFITARALGDYESFLRWASRQLRTGGKVVLWLGEKDCEELSTLGSWSWSRVLIPRSRRRFLLFGSPKN